MLPVGTGTVRLFVHLLAVSVWVGGQIALAAVVPVVRRSSPETARAVGRQFQRLAWPAFGLAVATGIWNLLAVSVADQDGEYLATLAAKLVLVVASGAFAAVHAFLTGPAVAEAVDPVAQRRRRAVSGASAGMGLVCALGATFYGVVLHG